MFVSCSTLCFSRRPLEAALQQIAELEFGRFELALSEEHSHLSPSEVADNPEAALQRIRFGPSLSPASLHLDFGDLDDRTYRKRFEAMCRLAKALTVAVLTVPAAPRGTPIETEAKRLAELVAQAHLDGLIVSVATHSERLTGNPADALALCKAVPGLALTLDPSHLLQGPSPSAAFDDLFPYVQNVHLRDTGKKPGEFQVRVGQGVIEYGKIVTLLQRYQYTRGLTIAILDSLDSPFDVEIEVRKLKLLLESLL